MTKEQIHRLIKKIRTRRDYYQMQKSLQIVADVLENLVDEDRKGEQGEQGIQGERGEKGEKGDKGDKGDSATLSLSDATGDDTYTQNVVAKPDGTLGKVARTTPLNQASDFEEYMLTSPLGDVITQGNRNAPIGKLLVNKNTGLGIIVLDFISSKNYNSNTDLLELPQNCPWVPVMTIEQTLPIPPHTRYITPSGTTTSSLRFLADLSGSKDLYYTYVEAEKSIYIIANNKKIRGKVLPNYRYKISFTTLFRKK